MSSPSQPPKQPPHVTPGGLQFDAKIERQMELRDWTAEQIDQAVALGHRIDAVNRANGAPATRYIHPVTGCSVVVENSSKRVIQVGAADFRFGPESGDVPGAEMRPASVAEPPTVAHFRYMDDK